MNKIKIFWLSVLALAGLTTPAQAYTVTVAEAQNCSVSLSPEKTSYDEGDEITVTITPNAGATFDSFELYYECTEAEWWEANAAMARGHGFFAPRRASSLTYRLESFYFNDDYDDEYEEVAEGEEYTFTMPARNVEIEVIYTADDTAYAITTTQKDNGTTSVSASTATAGTTVTITATPATGYVVDEVKAYEKVTSGSMVFEDELSCTEVTATTFTFIMPANPVRVEVTYKLLEFTLYDDADNSTTLTTHVGQPANVTISGRTLYKDGSWNTICLPFALSSLTDTPLEGATVKTLSSATFADGTLTLNFSSDLTATEAGKPYIVKWESGDDIVDPVFNNVTISSTEPTDVEGSAANFHGIFSPYATGGKNTSMLYLGADNTLYYPNADMTIGAFRAYFTLNGITAGDLPQQARRFVLNFGDEATGILTTDLMDYTDKAGAWYDMQGRRLTGKPSRKGIYINNGKKITIK